MNKDTRIALIGIIIEDLEQSKSVNELLHEYSDYIVGRLGIPYREKGVSIMSIVIDAEHDVISSLSGKLGMVKGINVKTTYTSDTKGAAQ